MPITSITTNADDLSLTFVGDYSVTVERLWQAYADPRQLERFFGPPQWPVKFVQHDMVPGGFSKWEMKGPGGNEYKGWWRFSRVEQYRRIEVDDGFSTEDGTPITDTHGRMVMLFEATTAGSRVTAISYFPDLAMMEQMAEGQAEGGRAAMEQLDDILAEPRAALV